MAILVTGCAGYIGAIASKLLLEAGYEVIGIDNLSRSKQTNVNDGIKFYQVCISDTDSLEVISQNHHIEAVMHFAAFIEVAESVEKPELYRENNYFKTKIFVDKLVELGINKFIFSSTAAVYGMPLNNNALREDDELKPINPYGENKLAVERYLEKKSQESDFSFITLRYFNVAGAYGDYGEAHDPESHIIPIALDTLLGHRPIFKLFGTDYDTEDGTAVRDYIHVVDLCKAHIDALILFANNFNTSYLNQAYNLGYQKGFSVQGIINSIEKLTGKKIPIEHSTRRPGDPGRLVADNSKAIAAGFFKPELNSIDRIIQDALDHRLKFHGSKQKSF